MRKRRTAIVVTATLLGGVVWGGVAMATASGRGAAVAQKSVHSAWHGVPATSVADARRRATAAPAARGAVPDGQTLIFVTHPGREVDIDIPPKGFGTGDFFWFEERVFDRTNTRQVGRDAVRCEAAIRTFQCEGTLLIKGKGKILISGVLFSDPDFTFAVVGGTGAYQGVGGELTVFDLAGGNQALVFHLVR